MPCVSICVYPVYLRAAYNVLTHWIGVDNNLDTSSTVDTPCQLPFLAPSSHAFFLRSFARWLLGWLVG